MTEVALNTTIIAADAERIRNLLRGMFGDHFGNNAKVEEMGSKIHIKIHFGRPEEVAALQASFRQVANGRPITYSGGTDEDGLASLTYDIKGY